jgi:competence ComEA-like helix-hairpin-helix protein
MKQDRAPSHQLYRLLFLLLPLSLVSCASLPRKYVIIERTADSTFATSAPVKVNINRASVHELAQLPGVGKVIAERIVSHRTRYGNFRRTEHLLMVRGISEKKFLRIQTLISE